MWKRSLLLAALFIPSVACLEIPGTHTLYLSPDGTVVWTVLEEDIRFDGPTRKSITRQEEEFLDRVAATEHSTAIAFEALYPGSLTAQVLREETPQVILTEAHFPGIDRLYLNLFSLFGAVSSVELKVGEERTRLEILLWLNDDEEQGEETENDEGEETENYDILLALLLECRIVLTEGKFVEAEGFEIVDGGRSVKPLELETEEAEENHTPVRLSLTWTTRDE